MNKVTLKQLTISNFKGFCKAEKTFGEKEVISGMNGQGKSSFFDAYRWCLGFDVTGYEPVLGFNNTRIGTADKPITTTVEIILQVDDLEYVLKRTSEQKWKLNQATGILEFTGNLSSYYFDSSSSCTATIYKEKISSLYGCSYSDIEIIINTTYFNSDITGKWGWSNRRKWLFDKLDIDSVVKGIADKYDLLAEFLKKEKDEIDIAKELSAQKTSIKKAQEDNLVLIEDKMKQLAVYQAIDFVDFKSKLAELQKEYEKLIVKSNKENKNEIVDGKLSELRKLQSEVQKLEREDLEEQEKFEKEKNVAYKKAMEVANSIQGHENDIENSKRKIAHLEVQIKNVESEAIHCAEFCPTCKQAIPTADIEKQVSTFEQSKEKRIIALKSELADWQIDLQTCISNLTACKAVYGELKLAYENVRAKSFEGNVVQIKALQEQIATINTEINSLRMSEVKETVSTRIDEIKTEMQVINKELGKQAILEDIKSAIEMLKANSLKLTAQEQMRLKKQAQLKEYILQKVALVNDSVNKWFDGITFNFFKWNGANAENEFESQCSVMLNGVNYQNLSTGEKMYADIKTTQGLMCILGINVALWVDEMQSLTKQFDCEQQLIGLKVVEGKTLENVLRTDKFYTLADCVARS